MSGRRDWTKTDEELDRMDRDELVEEIRGLEATIDLYESKFGEEIEAWQDEMTQGESAVFEFEYVDDDGADPWVGPPDEGEWFWTVEARTEDMDVLARWPAVGPHRAGAKRRVQDVLAPEIVEWGRTYVNDGGAIER